MRTPFPILWIGIAVICCATSQLNAQNAGDLFREIRRDRDLVDPQVFESLGELQSEESLEALQKSVKLLQFEVSYARAFFAIRHFRDSEAQDQAIEYLLDFSLRGTVEQRPWALRGLLEYESAADAAMWEVLKSSKDDEFRAKAVGHLLEALNDPANTKNLNTFLSHFKLGVSGSRDEALEFLALYPDKLKYKAFEDFLKNKKYSFGNKDFIVASLAEDQSPGAYRLLLLCLKDPAPSVALQALRTLEAHQYMQHEKALRKLCKNKSDILRFEAFQARARLLGDDPSWVKEIDRLAKSSDPIQRLIAVYQIGRFPRQEVMKRLQENLVDPDHAVRSVALLMLEQLRRRDSVPILIDRLERETPVMQYRVQKVLASLTGKSYGNQASTWRRWWHDQGADFVLPTAEEAYELGLIRAASWGKSETSSFYGVPVISSRVVFILDTSGSMEEKFELAFTYTNLTGTRLSVAKTQLIRALDSIGSGERFNLIFFDSKVRSWMPQLTKMSSPAKSYAIDYIETQKPSGLTAMYDALRVAYKDPDVDTIFLLSDGYPEGGQVQNPEVIRQRVHAWNLLRQVNIHCISVGGEIDLLRLLAQDSGGTYTVVY